MNALYPIPAFGELRGYYRDAAIAADQRGDAEAAQANADEAAGLLARVMPPRLIPPTLDDMLDERFDTTVLGLIALMRGKQRISEIHDRWADRLTARIDREDKA